MLSCIIWYKDTNLKAIHNRLRACIRQNQVVLSDTKIQIWKQFTTADGGRARRECCIIWYKDTNLKAIHNHTNVRVERKPVVLSDTKIQIWKQFTTSWLAALSLNSLYYLIQRYKFESNSQPSQSYMYSWLCCIIWYKDTNLKAIHNTSVDLQKVSLVVLSDTKIQIWKQFTTV